jgi:predicted nucleic acid-binding protein
MSEPPDTVARVITRHRHIAIDSNIVIYLLENDGPVVDRATEIIDAVEAGALAATLATVGLVEVLAGPARTDDSARFEEVADEIRAIRNLRLAPLASEIAIDAAWARGADRMRLADAIHLSTARAVGATAFVTNDRRIRSRPGLEVIYLSDLVAA